MSTAAILRLQWTDREQANASYRTRFAPHVRQLLEQGVGVAVEVRVLRNAKSREQEEKMHAMIRDIARQVKLCGKDLPPESWKRVLVDAFKHDTKDLPDLRDDWERFGDIELLPALNHPGFVMVGEQTRRFSRRLASSFIEWLYAFGAEQQVVWSAPKGGRP